MDYFASSFPQATKIGAEDQLYHYGPGLFTSKLAKASKTEKLDQARRTLSLDLCPPASPPYEDQEVETPRPLMLIPFC